MSSDIICPIAGFFLGYSATTLVYAIVERRLRVTTLDKIMFVLALLFGAAVVWSEVVAP